MAPRPALQAVVGAPLFLIKPNLHELALLVGRTLDDEESVEQAALELVGPGRSAAVVISLGAAGALLATGDSCERLRAPTVPISVAAGWFSPEAWFWPLIIGLLIGLVIMAGRNTYAAMQV